MDRNYCSIVLYDVRNPAWIETTVRLYICHTVIHRKLQNGVYMKKKIHVKKKGGSNIYKKKKKGGNIGSCPHVPVI
jgi:hypothetical protein